MAEGGHVVYAFAKYDFVATDEHELSIKKAERLVVLDESSQWWKVQNFQGQSGIVPSNYVKKCKPSLFESLKNTIRKRTGTSNRTDQTVIPAKEDSTIESFTVIAVYNYEAQKSDEMSLTKGDIVLVHRKSSDGWWNGRKDTGQSGWFPSNYVKVSFKNSDSSDSLEDAQKQICTFPKQVLTLFSFSASNCDELSFKQNEQLVILDRASESVACAEGWCTAQNAQGIIGLIPETYVLPISEDLTLSSCENESTRSPAVDLMHDISISRAENSEYPDRDWFIGKTTRAQCEKAMNQYADNGDFLVRESETHVGEYTLTMKTKQHIKHFRIKVDTGNYLIGQQEFHALDDLIEYYKKHAIYRLGNEKLFLNKPFVYNHHMPQDEAS